MRSFEATRTEPKEGLQMPKKSLSGDPFPGFVNMGFTLLLVVFLVITLVVFALLALSEARNDLEFSRQMGIQKANYYASCSHAERVLQQVDKIQREARKKGVKPDFSGLPVKVYQGKISWETPVDENRILLAEYDLAAREITAWQVISGQDWNNDDSVSIWIP